MGTDSLVSAVPLRVIAAARLPPYNDAARAMINRLANIAPDVRPEPLKRILWLFLAILAALVIVPFGVINRHPVTVLLDPFARPQPLLSADVPLSLLMFVTFMAGLVVGGLVVWFGQGKWRRTARTSRREVHLWRSEADRLANERDKSASGSGAKAVGSR